MQYEACVILNFTLRKNNFQKDMKLEQKPTCKKGTSHTNIWGREQAA